MSRASEAVSRLSGLALVALVTLASCDELGNPRQLTTGPTLWTSNNHELVTTTRSFRDPNTIRRLAADGFDDLDYADPSIGPEEAVTMMPSYLSNRMRTIAGGSSEIQRNIIAKSILVS